MGKFKRVRSNRKHLKLRRRNTKRRHTKRSHTKRRHTKRRHIKTKKRFIHKVGRFIGGSPRRRPPPVEMPGMSVSSNVDVITQKSKIYKDLKNGDRWMTLLSSAYEKTGHSEPDIELVKSKFLSLGNSFTPFTAATSVRDTFRVNEAPTPFIYKGVVNRQTTLLEEGVFRKRSLVLIDDTIDGISDETYHDFDEEITDKFIYPFVREVCLTNFVHHHHNDKLFVTPECLGFGVNVCRVPKSVQNPARMVDDNVVIHAPRQDRDTDTDIAESLLCIELYMDLTDLSSIMIPIGKKALIIDELPYNVTSTELFEIEQECYENGFIHGDIITESEPYENLLFRDILIGGQDELFEEFKITFTTGLFDNPITERRHNIHFNTGRRGNVFLNKAWVEIHPIGSHVLGEGSPPVLEEPPHVLGEGSHVLGEGSPPVLEEPPPVLGEGSPVLGEGSPPADLSPLPPSQLSPPEPPKWVVIDWGAGTMLNATGDKQKYGG